jgi:predicted amidophosphoribosyltransferase
VLLAVTCPVCGALGGAPCTACTARLRPAPPLPVPPGLDRCAAVLAYEGAGRELVARFKYRNQRAALPRLARAMAARTGGALADAVTWVPTVPGRRRRRGFDQAELLARAVARRLGVPCRRLLRRGPGSPQTGRPLATRRRGPALEAVGTVPPRVLIIDDVVTTGATLTAAAAALRRVGAAEVSALAAARTPPPRRGHAPEAHHGG